MQVRRGHCFGLMAAALMAAAGSPRLRAETLTLVPPDECVTTANGQICIQIYLSEIGEAAILGGQFFLEYDGPATCWEVVSVNPVSPFIQLFEIVTPPAGSSTPGTIDYAVALPGGHNGVTEDQAMATVCLRALSDEPDCCQQELRFRDHAPPTRLGSGAGSIQPPALVLGPPAVIGLDWHGPQLTCDSEIQVPLSGGCEGVMPDLIGEGLCSVQDSCCNTDAGDDVCDCCVTQVPAPGTPLGPGASVEVTVTVTDCCGHEAQSVVAVTAADETPPTVTCPENIEVYADACAGDGCSAVVAFEVSADDDCDEAPTIACVADLQDGDLEVDTVDPAGTVFPQGMTTVTCTASDDDGNVSEPCDLVVNVLGQNQIQVTVQLDGAPAPVPFTRCVKFELLHCPEYGGLLPTVAEELEATITFDPATRTGSTTLLVPCGCYQCIVAQDPLHTLRSAVGLSVLGDCESPNSDYQALFTGADALRGGDVDDDGWADITDVALILFRWGRCYGQGCAPPVGDPNTDCSFPPPVANTNPALDTTHCDISGDGFVGLSDLLYLTQVTNFLAGDESCTSDKGAGAGTDGGRTRRTRDAGRGPLRRISVRELQRRMLGKEVATYDLNGDGWLDMTDVRLFMKAQAK